jgi:hypothetical protein
MQNVTTVLTDVMLSIKVTTNVCLAPCKQASVVGGSPW